MLQCAPADSHQGEFRSISTASSSTGFSRNVDTEAEEKEEEEEEVDSDDQWSVAKISRDTHALAVETLSDLLRQNYDGGDGQPTAQDLIELMGHCLKTFFTFEGTTYEQIKGTPMGSPISGLIAEAVLHKLERRLFEEYKPKFWARYVDDIFVIIDQDKINYYAEVLNSIIPDLRFTMEEEVGDKLPILGCSRLPPTKWRTSDDGLQKTDEHAANAQLQQQPSATTQTKLCPHAVQTGGNSLQHASRQTGRDKAPPRTLQSQWLSAGIH
ncbi:hypothetical protein SprV_0100027100 [Sparganum proliferum]